MQHQSIYLTWLIQEIPNGLSLLSNNKSSFDYFNNVNIGTVCGVKTLNILKVSGLISKFVNKITTVDLNAIKRNIQRNQSIFNLAFLMKWMVKIR